MMAPSMQRVTRSKESARSAYNQLSRWYDFLSARSERKYRELGLEKLSAREGERILEIGFGTGHSLVSIARAVGPEGSVLGVDISDGMLAIAQKRLQENGLANRADLYRGDACHMDFVRSESLDKVFMSFTLELFDTPEIPTVLQECQRVLKPNGVLVVVAMTRIDPAGMAVRVYEWFHAHLPNFADCRPIFAQRLIGQAGFCIEDSSIASMWGLPVEMVLARKLPLDVSG